MVLFSCARTLPGFVVDCYIDISEELRVDENSKGLRRVTHHECTLGAGQCMSLKFPGQLINKDSFFLGFEGFKGTLLRYPSEFFVLNRKAVKLLANVASDGCLLC